MVTLSLSNSLRLMVIAPAKSKNGSITLMSSVLKSNRSVSEVTASKNEGNIRPVIKTKTESMIARTINPIVCGSFKTRKLMIEKKEANKSKTVDNSNTSIKIVFTKLLIYCL
mgnify:CR=1 FL=1